MGSAPAGPCHAPTPRWVSASGLHSGPHPAAAARGAVCLHPRPAELGPLGGARQVIRTHLGLSRSAWGADHCAHPGKRRTRSRGRSARPQPAGSGPGRPRPSADASLRGEVIPRVEPDYSRLLGQAGAVGCGWTSASRSLDEKRTVEEETESEADASESSKAQPSVIGRHVWGPRPVR